MTNFLTPDEAERLRLPRRPLKAHRIVEEILTEHGIAIFPVTEVELLCSSRRRDAAPRSARLAPDGILKTMDATVKYDEQGTDPMLLTSGHLVTAAEICAQVTEQSLDLDHVVYAGMSQVLVFRDQV